MSSLTSFLKLFKWDPKVDGSQKFNIPKALNENVDKIEENAVGVNTALANKSDKKYNGKMLTTTGWYRVAKFNTDTSNHAFSNSLIDIHTKWNNTSGQSSIILLSNANATSNLTLLSSTERTTIDKIRIIQHPNEENKQNVCLDIHYNVTAQNNVSIQIHDNSLATQPIYFKPVEETVEGETVLSTLSLDTYNLNQAIGTLSSLTTTDKTSLVKALNELRLQTRNYMNGNNVQNVDYAGDKTFDGIMRLNYSSIFCINGNETTINGAGFPEGAYGYGLLITLIANQDYARTQIYITDNPHGTSSGRGIYVRTRIGGSWVKLSGTTVAPVTVA